MVTGHCIVKSVNYLMRLRMANSTTEDRGTLLPGEYHPSADSAAAYIRSMPLHDLALAQESLCSCALSGNRLAEVCAETLRRFLDGETVSDRYLLGLAWFLSRKDRES